MSSKNIAIRVRNVSKCYQIYDKPHDRLKQFLIPKLNNMFGKNCKQYFHEFWALKNVSLEIKKGETVGIIGRNGSGKSTLLQIICGTLFSSSGSVETNGRVAALLELGSGFNPEFTGRENIYINASILGLSNQQIDERFNDIVSFSGIHDFIDQPIKNYSSGMVVRLAFAVIANVDADILVIDEALAVGDAVFTQKCMRFLRNFMEVGTVIFVSHDTGSVLSLCKHAIWLNEGRVTKFGNAKEVVEEYTQYTLQEIYGDEVELKSVETKSNTNVEVYNIASSDTEAITNYSITLGESHGWESGSANILAVDLLDIDGSRVVSLKPGDKVTIEIMAKANKSIYSPIIGWFAKDRLGQILFGENTYNYVQTPLLINQNEMIKASFEFKMPMLANGDYSITVSIAEGDLVEHTQHNWLHDAVMFKVSSNTIRYGLVGIPFQSVVLTKISNEI